MAKKVKGLENAKKEKATEKQEAPGEQEEQSVAQKATHSNESAPVNVEQESPAVPDVSQPVDIMTKEQADEEKVDLFVEIKDTVKKLKKEEALDTIRKLMEAVEANFFTVGGALSRVYAEKWYESYGYENFSNMVETEFGIKYRKAMYLVNIYDHLVETGIKYGQVKKIGWTKMKELVPVVDKNNVDDWVEKAENMSTLQLHEEVKLAQESESETKTEESTNETAPNEGKKVTTKTFKLYEDQRDVVDKAIQKAKADASTEYDGQALEVICTEYLSGTGKKKAKAPSLEDMIKEVGYEKVLDVTEKVFEKEGLQITAQLP